jgi:hypothetical protein
MAGEMEEAWTVGQPLQMRHHFGRHRCNDVTVRDMVAVRHGSNQATEQPCVKIIRPLLKSQKIAIGSTQRR